MTTSNILIQSLLNSPLLVDNLPEAPQLNRQSLCFSPSSVELNFQQKLGHLYEDALAALLKSSPSIDLLEKGLQIQVDIHSTVGELDFLIREADKSLTHLELATKFYLAVNTDNGIIFPGPDARDNYSRKIERLRSHQLTLTKRHQAHLPPIYHKEKIRVKQLIYGCLFDHIDEKELSSPIYINPKCRRGKWLYHHEVSDFFSANSKFHIIPKHLWPVPIELLRNTHLEQWLPNKPIKRCLMLRANNTLSPYFIAPNHYPKQSQ